MNDFEAMAIKTETKLSQVAEMMSSLEKDTKTNLKVALEALSLSQELNRRFERHLPEINEKLEVFIDEVKSQTSPIWQKLEKHADKLSDHSGKFKWMVGIFVGIQAAWVAFLEFFRNK